MKTERLMALLSLVAVVLIVYLLSTVSSLRDKLETSENLVESLNAEVVIWKDKDSLSNAKIQTIQTQDTKTFLRLQTQDSIIMDLQKVVKDFSKELKNRGSATIVENTTDVDTSNPTIVVGDSIYPTYKSNVDLGGWITGLTVANKDSTFLDLKVKNKYSLVIGEEKQGLFKKRKPFAQVKNYNPYTNTEAIRTYEVQVPSPKRFSVGPNLSVGVDGDGEMKPFLGFGIQYNLIRF